MRRLVLAAALLATLPAALALMPPAEAQTIKKNLTRSFNGEPYHSSVSFFTALGPEAVLNFTRVQGTCREVGSCESDADCHGGVCQGTNCVGQVDVYPTVGQVAVIRKEDYCRAAVCGDGGGGVVPPECDPALYPCLTPCSDPTNCFTCPLNAGLCLCGGGNECPAADAPLTSAQAPFSETFQVSPSTKPWVFNHATVSASSFDGYLRLGENALADPSLIYTTALAGIRFPVTQGEQYVLFLKHSFHPFVGGLQCFPFGGFELHFEGRAAVCDQDSDGYAVDQDCADGNPAIHPNAIDAQCDGIDDDCDFLADEDFPALPDDWNPLPPSVLSARMRHTMVSTGSRAIVWGGTDGSQRLATGAFYESVSGAWSPTQAVSSTQAREGHTAVWTGTLMVVWGGMNNSNTLLNTGLRYDPAGGLWQPTSATGTEPAARVLHTAVWTGSRMIIWGGLGTLGAPLNTGGIYDPATNTWTSMATTAAPIARFGHTAVWTGSRMLVWGGRPDMSGVTGTGGAYDPATNTWSPILPGGVGARADHTAVWDGTTMIVWGGVNGAGTPWGNGGRYNPAGAGSWSLVNSTGAPPARSSHAAVWSGTKMIVWGGNGPGSLKDGGLYDPAADSWSPLISFNSPSARQLPAAAWIPSIGRMLVWGGADGTVVKGDGGLYLPDFTCGVGQCRGSGHTICILGEIQYTCQVGQPTLEICNQLDDDCDGLTDNALPPGLPYPVLSVGPSGSPPSATASLDWTPSPGGQSGDVMRGLLKELVASGGDYTLATNVCLSNDDGDRVVVDAAVPPVGDGFWYLVREVSTCGGAGTYDTNAFAQVGSRDAELAASPAHCP